MKITIFAIYTPWETLEKFRFMLPYFPLYKRSNWVISDFRVCDSSTRDSLHRTCCVHMYGCELWDLNYLLTYLMLLQPSGTSPLWADHVLLDISCGVSGRLHDNGISLFINTTSVLS